MIFLNSASSAAELVFYLPLCTHTDTKGKPREARVWNIILNPQKNTIFNEHPVLETKVKLLAKALNIWKQVKFLKRLRFLV